jgi:signal transduction histidine kinase
MAASIAAPAAGTAEKAGSGRWIVVAAIIAAAGILSAFYGINDYAANTGEVLKNANANHSRFEAVFKDLRDARYRTLNIAAAVLMQSRLTLEPFAKGDRATLIARTEPFFETLKREHGIDQLNFWTPPAVVFYRAGHPNEFGMDLSSYRKSIVAANQRRAAISAVETGLGGVIALRGIAPVVLDDKFVGVLEFVSSFNIPLDRAGQTTGLKWAVSVSKEVSERVERPADSKKDVWQGTDVYYQYSDDATLELMRHMKFDPRAKGHVLADADGRTVYVKAFPVVNFSGAPTVTVATLLDVTKPFNEALTAALLKGIIGFLLMSVLGVFAYVRFGNLREQFGGSLSRQQKEIEERTAACDAALAKLREVDVIKRGFFTNLVAAVNEPLQAVAGQLKTLPPELAKAGVPDDVSGRLKFAAAETARLAALVEDYQQIEMFRQKLVKGDSPPVALAGVVSKALDEDLAMYRRLPQLAITAAVPADLPPTRANPDLLRRAIASLVTYAAQRGGQGKIMVVVARDDAGWVTLSVSGSAYTAAGAPTEALLDESRQFITRLASGGASSAGAGPLVGVVLARVIIEFYGGSLAVSTVKDAPGFVVKLPAATA